MRKENRKLFFETAKVAARLAEMAFDGEMKVSPIKFDNILRGIFGGMAKYGTDAIDWALVKAQVVDVPPAPVATIRDSHGGKPVVHLLADATADDGIKLWSLALAHEF